MRALRARRSRGLPAATYSASVLCPQGFVARVLPACRLSSSSSVSASASSRRSCSSEVKVLVEEAGDAVAGPKRPSNRKSSARAQGNQ
eukprot:414432-Rhodomonas_salina.2